MGPIKNKPMHKTRFGTRNEKHSPGYIDELAEKLLEWMDIEENVFFKDFCVFHHLDVNRLADFARSSEKFKEAMNIARDIQESKFAMGGLKRKYDSGMSKFMLMNHHGYTNKAETKVSGDSKDPIAIFLSEIDGKSKDLVEEKENE